MHSRVNRSTHRFWQSMAIIVSLFLVGHGMMSLWCCAQTILFQTCSLIEVVIGLGTIAVDGWFLLNV